LSHQLANVSVNINPHSLNLLRAHLYVGGAHIQARSPRGLMQPALLKVHLKKARRAFGVPPNTDVLGSSPGPPLVGYARYIQLYRKLFNL